MATGMPYISRDATETPELANIESQEIRFTDDPAIDTIYKLLERQCKTDGDLPLYGYREYLPNGERGSKWVWQTRSQILTRAKNFAEGLAALGLRKGDKVGFMSYPLYETLPDKDAAKIIEHSEAKVICVLETFLPKLHSIFEIAPAIKDQLKSVIVLDSRPNETRLRESVPRSVENFNMTYTEVEELGEKKPTGSELASGDDVTVLMYTSGTTGNAKGAMLSSRAIMATGYALSTTMPPEFGLDPENIVHISYLPYSHVFSVVMESTILLIRGRSGVSTAGARGLVGDMGTLRPTVMAGVPRVFTKIYDVVEKGLNKSVIKRIVYDLSFEWKRFWKYYGYKTPLVDKLVFSQITSLMGGKMQITISAGAPLNSKVSDFLQIVVGDCFHGYGLTETAGLGLRTERTDFLRGPEWLRPYRTNRVKLVNCEEMNYYVTDSTPRGEICVRGPNVFEGYFKDAEQTRLAVDEDGWFHTGDIGEMDKHGRIRIIDRKKSLFKLAQGEYVSSEFIEGVMDRSIYIGCSFIYGNSTKDFAVAIIVPSEQEIREWLSTNKPELAKAPMSDICKDRDVIELIQNEIITVAKKENVRGYEIPKSFRLTETPFENIEGMVTPSTKLRRKPLAEYFKKLIDDMYAKPPMFASLSQAQEKSAYAKKND